MVDPAARWAPPDRWRRTRRLLRGTGQPGTPRAHGSPRGRGREPGRRGRRLGTAKRRPGATRRSPLPGQRSPLGACWPTWRMVDVDGAVMRVRGMLCDQSRGRVSSPGPLRELKLPSTVRWTGGRPSPIQRVTVSHYSPTELIAASAEATRTPRSSSVGSREPRRRARPRALPPTHPSGHRSAAHQDHRGGVGHRAGRSLEDPRRTAHSAPEALGCIDLARRGSPSEEGSFARTPNFEPVDRPSELQ